MIRNPLVLLLSFIVLGACYTTQDQVTATSGSNSKNAENSAAVARRITNESIIVDTHIDVPYRLRDKPANISVATEDGDFDHPRAVSGGLNAPFMSIYTPASAEAEGTSKDIAEQLIDSVIEISRNWPTKFAIALTPQDIREHFSRGIISLPLGMENGSPIEGDLSNLEYFYARGIRYITLAHSLSNHISDSSYDENRQWGGLSEFGIDVVKEMNRLGIMIDISHVSDDAFWQVLKLTQTPVIASHSSARHFTPGFERNMSDEMIRALAKNGGVIHINFGSSFITKEANEYSSARSDARDLWQETHPQFSDDDAYTMFPPIYAAENGPFPFATLEDVLDHIDHVVKLTSINNVGVGSDYDGVGDSLPVGLKDVATYPNLVEGLLKRGYIEADIKKILGENSLRVWQQVIEFSDQAATTSNKT